MNEYDIKSEEEWIQILKNHNMPYYPRYKNYDSEITFMKIRNYFEDNPANKPSFCKKSTKIMKLEKRLGELYRLLQTIDSLDKLRILNIKLDIKYIESKLKIRR
jgi:hypothetical protein